MFIYIGLLTIIGTGCLIYYIIKGRKQTHTNYYLYNDNIETVRRNKQKEYYLRRTSRHRAY